TYLSSNLSPFVPGEANGDWDARPDVPLGRTTSIRAASRGCMGRSAMRSGGRSKSKRSVRMIFSYPSPCKGEVAAEGGGWGSLDVYDDATPPSALTRATLPVPGRD